jgi:hypothetical protein
MVTASESEEPITVNVVILEDGLFFQPYRMSEFVSDVKIELTHEDGTKFNSEEINENEYVSLFSLFQMPKGNYTWIASYDENDNGKMKKIANGSFFLDNEFIPYFSVTPIDKDNYYNDLAMNIRGMNRYEDYFYDITIKSKNDNKIIDQELNYTGLYVLSDLDEGDYQIIVSKNNDIYLDTTIHSYGTKEARDSMFGMIVIMGRF